LLKKKIKREGDAIKEAFPYGLENVLDPAKRRKKRQKGESA